MTTELAARVKGLIGPCREVDDITYWRASLHPECCAEFSAEPECACPHEHWHIAAAANSCLDVHLEEDGSAHIIFDCGDWDRELTVQGVSGIEEARACAFGWLSSFIQPTKPALRALAKG
jgi:hypothetical protein